MCSSKILDTSSELIFQRHKNGIKLLPPVKYSQEGCMTVGDVFNLPLNAGFLNTDSIIQNMNETTVKVSGFKSVQDSIGKTVRIACNRENANFSINHDRAVIKANKPMIAEEYFIRLVDDVAFQALIIKLPWYDKDDRITGVFFCAFPINSFDAPLLSKSLSLFIKLGLMSVAELETYNPHGAYARNKFCIYFSKRESQCLNHLIRGKTAKLIAQKLKLSPRAVESYLVNIKNKVGVRTKAELIEKVIELRYISDCRN